MPIQLARLGSRIGPRRQHWVLGLGQFSVIGVRKMKPEDKAVVQKALKLAYLVRQKIEAAYLAGFQATGEGYNAEYPFEGRNPEDDAAWVRDRDNALRQLLEQPEPVQEPFGTYMGHRMTPAGTKEFWGFADASIPEGTKLYTTPQAQPAPVQEPEHCDPSATVYKLVEMVMSDCGHSSNNQRLLDRIAERIQRHIDATTPQAQPTDHSEQHLDMVDHADELTIAYLDGVHTGKRLVKREWVGLEKEDMPDGDNPMYDHDYFIKGMIWADVKLREKNGGGA
jgi:hypothetical protein